MTAIDTIVWDNPVLFVDSNNLESTHSVARRWHKPVRDPEPVIIQDQPWEEGLYFTYSNYTVRFDPADGKIKCWYEDLGKLDGKAHPYHNSLLYAESADGIHFEKPGLDVCSVDGTPTNIVMGYAKGGPSTPANPWAEGGVHSNAVIIAPNPTDPERRFLTVFSDCRIDGGTRRHVTSGACSADGLHWTAFEERPSYGSSRDSLSDVSCLWYDPDSREFVQNTRHGWMYGSPLPGGTARIGNRWFPPYHPNRPDLMNKRRVFQARSHDFLHWSEPLEICCPDDIYDNLDEAHYGMPQFRVGREYFGFLGIYHTVDNEMYVRLMHSRDGLNWRPTDNANPFLAPRGEGHWDAHMVSMTSEPIERDGEWLFYHGGTNAHHDWWMSGAEELDTWEAREPERIRFSLGLARLRQEGFASLYAGPMREGAFKTKPLCSEGKRLVINAACGPDGYVRAAVETASHEAVGDCSMENCDVFTGDDTAHTVTWNGSADVPDGGRRSRRRVHIVMCKAHIYSIRFL